MPNKVKGKSSKKKATSRKPVKKAIMKKVIKEKVAKKPEKKKAAKEKTAKKLATGKKVKKNKPVIKKAVAIKTATIEPGLPQRILPPIEKLVPVDKAIGIVTHYYSHIGVAVIQLNNGSLKTGATIHIKGHVTDFTQSVESMEYEHQHIDHASAGQSVGLKVKDDAREHDIVFLVK
jgi:translation elongation factor EF-Tu-like GTPase